MTKLYLGIDADDHKKYHEIMKTSKYVLISFYYVKNFDVQFGKAYQNIILDSGAFTLLSNAGKLMTKKEIYQYADEYIQYIKDYKIKQYVELDLDSIYGYDFVLELRSYLEREIGYQCIPIWHHSRGKEEFIRMCKEYKFAGIGGIAGREELSKHKKKYHLLNRLANSYGCRLHGMGFTPTRGLKDYGFYTVDSTSWKSGGRFGTIYVFKHDRLVSLSKTGKRLKNYKELDKSNLKEWIKYQRYLDKGWSE